MQVSVARRVGPRSPGELGACLLLGFGIGTALGFLLSEVLGAGGHRRIGRLIRGRSQRHPPLNQATSTLAAQLREVLKAEPGLAGEAIELRQTARGAIELRGWVSSRAARTLAYRMASVAVGTGEVVNHLLVRGEDDQVASTHEETSLSA